MVMTRKAAHTLDYAIFVMSLLIEIVTIARAMVAWHTWDTVPKVIWSLVIIFVGILISLQIIKYANRK